MSFTPMDFRHYTVPELRKEIKERAARGFDNGVEPNADGAHGLPKPLSRMIKVELIDTLVRYANAQVKQEASVGEPQVFQGAMHEADEDTVGALMRQANQERQDAEAVDELITAEFSDLGQTLRELASAARAVVEPTRAAARALGAVAWANMRATVRSMGHKVHGKVVDTVVDTVLRTPDASGSGRVCLVVQHDGHPTRRTLHALVDVDLTPLAS